MRILGAHQSAIRALAVTPDGQFLYTSAGSQTTILGWDLGAGKVVDARRLRGSWSVNALACSPSGLWLGAADRSWTGTPTVWPLAGGDARELPRGVNVTRLTSLAFHPTEDLIVSPLMTPLDQAAGIQVHDLRADSTWHGPLQMAADPSPVVEVAFAPDGLTVAATGSDQRVRLWDLTARCITVTHTCPLVPRAPAFRPDGAALAFAGGQAVLLLDLATSHVDVLREHRAAVTAVAYSPDGALLASAGRDGRVLLRDGRTGEVVRDHHLDIGPLTALAWRPGGGLIAGGRASIAVLDPDELLGPPRRSAVARGEPLSLGGHTRRVTELAFSPDGASLASVSGDTVRVWDYSAGPAHARLLQTITPRPERYVTAVSWSPDHQSLALLTWDGGAVYVMSGNDGTGRALASSDARPPDWPEPRLSWLSFSPSGDLILGTSSEDPDSLRLVVQKPDGSRPFPAVLVPRKRSDSLAALVAAPDGETFYLARSSGHVYRWTPATGGLDRVFIQPGASVSGLALSPDGRTLVTLAGQRVHVRDLPSGQLRLTLPHPNGVSGAAFVAAGRLLTTCLDHHVRLWDLSGGTELLALDPGMNKLTCLAVAPDGLTFVAGTLSRNRLVLMDVPD